MKKILYVLIALISLSFSMVVNAEVTVEKKIYSTDGSMKFTFNGLTIDENHGYEFGFTTTKAQEIEKWYTITELTDNSVITDINIGTTTMREVVNAGDTGYITIKDKTADTIVLEDKDVDLSIPYLLVPSIQVLNNGYVFKEKLQIAMRNASNSKPYYKYEKITDDEFIKKYKEIKENSGDYLELESMLKEAPNNGYTPWSFWNGYSGDQNGYGYPTYEISVPDEGLYYLWLYFAGNGVKNLYGVILVDNLAKDIKLESISIPSTETIEIGKTLTLKPTFNPEGATNKIVTWTSSDETVATVDNAGKITPLKVGSTIITVTSEDGNKTDTCTVTVTKNSEVEDNKENNNTTTTPDTEDKKDETNNESNVGEKEENKVEPPKEEEKKEETNNTETTKEEDKKDETEKDQPLEEGPKTGVNTYLVISIITLSILSVVFIYMKKKNIIFKI